MRYRGEEKAKRGNKTVFFQSKVDFRGLKRQSITNADMIHRFPVILPAATQALLILNTVGWNPSTTTQ